DALAPLADAIEFAFIYGSMARAQEHAASDVDLMLVGTLEYPDAMLALDTVAGRLRRDVNPTIYTRRELLARARNENAFVTRVLAGPKLWLYGGEQDLAAAASKHVKRPGALPLRH
ncbi:MAG TPA: nucleotidyltransferase domain-containing protein, partial [Ramlibacter sp.]|nr:nucleotidyltransferase domain-containing protein [Ramlibacter sp.]